MSKNRLSNKKWLVSRAAVLLIVAYVAAPTAIATDADDWTALQLLGREISAGTKSKFSFIKDSSFEASYLNMPVFVAGGFAPGPTLYITAGVHGDELNGVEVARRTFAQSDPEKLRGTLIALPAINAAGVRTGTRYLTDRRDLNRAFPGRAGGSVAAVIAHAVFEDVLRHCDALVDLHTAPDNRANLPQIRADLTDPDLREVPMGSDISGQGRILFSHCRTGWNYYGGRVTRRHR